MNQISTRMREAIKYLRISQSALSLELDFSKSYVSSIVNGTNKTPSREFYDKLETRYGISRQWLKYGTGEMVNPQWSGLSNEKIQTMAMLEKLPRDVQIHFIELIRMCYQNRRG